MTDTTPDRIIKDCLLAAKCMEETSTFETGQAILRDAAKELDSLVAERDQLKAKLTELESVFDDIIQAAVIEISEPLDLTALEKNDG